MQTLVAPIAPANREEVWAWFKEPGVKRLWASLLVDGTEIGKRKPLDVLVRLSIDRTEVSFTLYDSITFHSSVAGTAQVRFFFQEHGGMSFVPVGLEARCYLDQ